MLSISYKMTKTVVIFIYQPVSLCVTMPECARACSATLYSINFCYSFFHYKVQFLWLIGALFKHIFVPRMKLFVSLKFFICYIANIGLWKYVFTRFVTKSQSFSLLSRSRRSYSTGVAPVLNSCHSCLTCVALVLFVLHLCFICVTRVALESLVSGTCVAKNTRSIREVCFIFMEKDFYFSLLRFS